ncbi:MAG: ATP synthase F0 subunit A [Elusimicrobia bacterium CG06_land_8_20_14_3_00_38_11]|nr:MAG: ATP synthase F0 subunit A [Elusimicrobia bacterium CG06_land_8_20_14_3_00_38_11]
MQIVKEAIEYNIPHIPTAILMILITWGIIFILSILSVRKISLIPSGLQNFFEMVFEGIFNLADTIIGPEAKRHYPLFLGIFLYIFISNILGVIPGMISPTSNLNIPIVLAVIVFIYYNIHGFLKYKTGYLKHFMIPGLPKWAFPINILYFSIELISQFVRPFSLSLRLFCNVFAKETLLGVLGILVITFFLLPGVSKAILIMPLLLRPIIIILAVLVGFVQALIFLILTIIYVGGAVKSEH